MATESTVKITSADTSIGTVGVIDNCRVVPGTKDLGFENADAGGEALPVGRQAQAKVQSFTTHVAPVGAAQGLLLADAVKLFLSTQEVTLAAGTTNGDADFDAVGPVQVELSGDSILVCRLTVG